MKRKDLFPLLLFVIVLALALAALVVISTVYRTVG
jgi:hypothetical protein